MLNLNRTITLRQILKFFSACLIVAILAYCWLVWNHWDHVNRGGVSVETSEYRARIPERCLASIEVHRGPTRKLSSTVFLAPRTYTVNIEKLVATPECTGYQLLTGLHGDQWASFRVIYVNARGEKLVTRTVEYLKK